MRIVTNTVCIDESIINVSTDYLNKLTRITLGKRVNITLNVKEGELLLIALADSLNRLKTNKPE